MMTVEDLKPVIVLKLKAHHAGSAHRAEKWEFVEAVCGVTIAESERNNNNLFERRVRAAISELRKEGALICSDTTGGYWWAESLEDVMGMSDSLRDRAKDLLKTARQLRAQARREFGGQMRMQL